MTAKPLILMDLDNTILDFDRQEAAAISAMLRERGIDPTDERLSAFRRINVRCWELLENGELTRRQVLVGRFEEFFKELGVALDAQSAEDSYAAHLCEGHYFVSGAEELLETLYGRCALYIISNGNARVQDARLASSGITKYFERIFISENMGADKPSRRFFDIVIAGIPDFDPARALVVGDSLTSDIRGGRNAGLKTCWFNPKRKPPCADIPADYEIAALAELPALIDRIYNTKEQL